MNIRLERTEQETGSVRRGQYMWSSATPTRQKINLSLYRLHCKVFIYCSEAPLSVKDVNNFKLGCCLCSRLSIEDRRSRPFASTKSSSCRTSPGASCRCRPWRRQSGSTGSLGTPFPVPRRSGRSSASPPLRGSRWTLHAIMNESLPGYSRNWWLGWASTFIHLSEDAFRFLIDGYLDESFRWLLLQ